MPETGRAAHPPRTPEHEARISFEAGTSGAFVALYAAFRPTLTDDQAATLKQLIDLAERQADDWNYGYWQGVIGGVARHLPGVGPAIVALTQHVIDAESTPRAASSCGLARDAGGCFGQDPPDAA